MHVEKIFVNTHKYDFHLAKICIASIRYWYPDIPILLIKEFNAGDFDTSFVEKTWNVQILNIERKKFGWGYGKLEPLFLENQDAFLVVDSDTVMIGPVIDAVKNINAQFIVDDEVQPAERFNEIYYNLDRIRELEENFIYPGYSFNSGQWFGTSNVLTRNDFSKSLDWTEPPKPKFPEIVFNGDQAHLNFVLHWQEQLGKVSIAKMRLMIWPEKGNGDFIELSRIREKKDDYPYVIHWAGMSSKKMSDLPRADILSFFEEYYYSRAGSAQFFIDRINKSILIKKRGFKFLTKSVVNLFSNG
jgi:hypothetical protein